jgi:hypothetical protein
MVSEWFTWTAHDIVEDLRDIYYNIILKKPIGEYPIGTQLSSVEIDYWEGKLRIFERDDTETHTTYKLTLVIED